MFWFRHQLQLTRKVKSTLETATERDTKISCWENNRHCLAIIGEIKLTLCLFLESTNEANLNRKISSEKNRLKRCLTKWPLSSKRKLLPNWISTVDKSNESKSGTHCLYRCWSERHMSAGTSLLDKRREESINLNLNSNWIRLHLDSSVCQERCQLTGTSNTLLGVIWINEALNTNNGFHKKP